MIIIFNAHTECGDFFSSQPAAESTFVECFCLSHCFANGFLYELLFLQATQIQTPEQTTTSHTMSESIGSKNDMQRSVPIGNKSNKNLKNMKIDASC